MSTQLPAELTAALAGRYDLRRVVGQGGMATVYQALDSRHQRDVALKVLLPGLAAQVGAERFIKEIRIAARLTHPHILPLYDSGEAAGFLYYVMPYLREPSLRQRLTTTRRLELHEALTIAARVADALTYAHRMGILHRDIKPENVLFAEGHAIVADFGIAKAISSASGGSLTRTGFPLGTPGYMSPEQAAGLGELDGRADVYGLAALTYEMLVGEVLPPGRWPAEDAVRSGRFRDVPVAHRVQLDALGAGMEAALVRGLAMSHDQRTASAQEFIAALSMPGSAPRRRYDTGDVQEIVRRATELEASRPTAGGALTIGGVEALGAEVDLAPSLVREAARSLTRLDPAPRELTGSTGERFRSVAYSTWQLMDPTTPPDEGWGFSDLVGVILFSVLTAGILPMVFFTLSQSRKRRLRRFFKLGTPALAEIIEFRPEAVGFDVKLTRVRYEFVADGQMRRGSDVTLPVVADRWRVGDRLEILYMGRNYDSMIATSQ
ncbi:MAG TPA: serine/threonine-protein kinase [Gemmatimonadales bacterium]|nr:serine/threonine-protein kinase [Gemmatimonadales bacterium]